jgi:hypothetical protein
MQKSVSETKARITNLINQTADDEYNKMIVKVNKAKKEDLKDVLQSSEITRSQTTELTILLMNMHLKRYFITTEDHDLLSVTKEDEKEKEEDFYMRCLDSLETYKKHEAITIDYEKELTNARDKLEIYFYFNNLSRMTKEEFDKDIVLNEYHQRSNVFLNIITFVVNTKTGIMSFGHEIDVEDALNLLNNIGCWKMNIDGDQQVDDQLVIGSIAVGIEFIRNLSVTELKLNIMSMISLATEETISSLMFIYMLLMICEKEFIIKTGPDLFNDVFDKNINAFIENMKKINYDFCSSCMWSSFFDIFSSKQVWDEIHVIDQQSKCRSILNDFHVKMKLEPYFVLKE